MFVQQTFTLWEYCVSHRNAAISKCFWPDIMCFNYGPTSIFRFPYIFLYILCLCFNKWKSAGDKIHECHCTLLEFCSHGISFFKSRRVFYCVLSTIHHNICAQLWFFSLFSAFVILFSTHFNFFLILLATHLSLCMQKGLWYDEEALYIYYMLLYTIFMQQNQEIMEAAVEKMR